MGDPSNGGYKEYYLRDAQGNIMAMYRYTNAAGEGPSLKVTERPVYGSARIGSYTRQLELYHEPAVHAWPYVQPMQAPLKHYELTDHLGNVAAVVSGRLLPGNNAGSPYQPELVSAQTLEAYGALLPNRNWNSSAYAWGLNGQLKDDEVYGPTGTSTTAEFWQYDTRVVRRWNVDPEILPSSSAYHVFELNPIWKVDPKGNRADDYDSDGNKISNLGGNKIDFFHQKGGDTKVVDRETKATAMIPNGERLMRGYTQRDAGVGPMQIYREWDRGFGPVKSIFSSFSDESTGPFESLRSPFSLYAKGARERVLESGDASGRADVDDYGKFNPFIATGMWEQMIGRAGVEWYKLGDKSLFIVTDRKSLSSFGLHLIPESWNFERSSRPSYGANTYQTYIWTESMTDVRYKNSRVVSDKLIKEQMRILNQSRVVPLGPK